ncbi:MAG: plasmid pRiA4b ORF-3 family protein [Nitrospirae bacterium]|nr:plasmid pRiA4b ORF-3 family protein [Nitrospirota bacterium]
MGKNKTVYQLNITLKGSKPPIWRRFAVNSEVKLSTLHVVIQEVMGWTDSHLHQFRQKDVYYVTEIDELDYNPFSGYEMLLEKKFKLSQVLVNPKDKIIYEYDFGDGWEHVLTLEKILEGDAKIKTPVCLDGARACPPEDCGGIYGYYDMLAILKDPDNPEYDDMKEWLGEGFDPDAFDVEEINYMLKGIRSA